MKRLTNAQLVAQLEASHVAYQRLLDEATYYQQECARLTERAAPMQRSARELAHANYVASLLAAREQAMATRTTVRVG